MRLLEVKKSLGHAQIGLLWGFNSKFPTSIPTFLMHSPPPRGDTMRPGSFPAVFG